MIKLSIVRRHIKGERLLAVALLVARAVSGAGALPVPSTGVYLGIWANPVLAPNQESAIEVREGPSANGIGRRFALHLHYYAWSDLSQDLDSAGVFQPDQQLQGDISHGRVPVISWACDSKLASSNHVIAGGDSNEDAVITATAKALAQYPGPVLLRWFWEFNVLANNQSCRGDSGGKPTSLVYNDFIGAWQRIWRLFQSAGATNVVFLWNPGHYNVDGDADDPHGFYPGNNYVDWIGLDTYQRTTTASFDDDFGLFYNDFSGNQYGNKPLMVGENGSQGFAQNSSELQRTYLQGLLSDVQANRYPLLKAYDYFDSAGNGNWVLDDNNGQGNGGLAAFAALAASKLFSPATVTFVANAEGENPAIAPNTWVEIKGVNLAPAGFSSPACAPGYCWQPSDFVNNKMPTQLNGVSATVNGKSAFVYYISPSQINILTPPDAMTGTVQVVVSNNGIVSSSFTTQAEALSPSFFVFNGGPYLAATHVGGALIGPTTLFPKLTTPAKPNETIVMYANGFGPTSTPAASGSILQSGSLLPLPVVKIGGVNATVQFAGLVAPGEFQFNVVVPSSIPNGDQSITATYGGQSTQAGTLVTIQN